MNTTATGPEIPIPATDMKIKVVPDWRESYKWISIWCWGIASALQGTWVALPDDLKAGISPTWVNVIALVLGVAGFIGRYIDQPPVLKPDTATDESTE